jgi:hypothetical protein
MIAYSKHFYKRLLERKISLDAVMAILLGEVDTLVIPSKTDKTVNLVLGFIDGKGIAVIVNKYDNVLITVRRMRKNEEQLFYKEV